MCKKYMLYKKNINKYILIIITQFDKYLHHFTYLVILISFDVLSQDGYCSYYFKSWIPEYKSPSICYNMRL